MKTITLFIFVSAACYSQDTICLTKPEYENVYNGLKQRDFYKKRSAEYLSAVHNLNNIIIRNNDSLQTSLQLITSLNQELYVKQDELLKLTKETPWYAKWYLWLGVGCLTGIIVK